MTTITQPAPVAELDRRFYAFALDRAIAWTLYALAGIAAWWWFFRDDHTWVGIAVVALVAVVVNLLFAMLLGSQGTSPGKAVMGLRVVDHSSGSPIGVARALLRIAVLGTSTLPMLGLGVATLAWTAVEDRSRERRGWHDHVTGSLVVDVRPRVVAEVEPDDRPRAVVNLTAMRLMPARPAEAPSGPAPQPVTPPPTPSVPPPPTPPPTPSAPPPPTMPPPPPPVTRTGPRPSSPATPPAPAAGRWRVSFDTGETMLVEGLGLVGRRPEGRTGEPVRHVVPLRSENMSISKTHAQFHLAADGTLVVMDRGSTNGSILVRQGVSRELSAGKPATLLDGDRVLFGDRQMQVSREHT
jgi:uncharacterized RDD family membrane protein YckC